jgi:hypothetical protein
MPTAMRAKLLLILSEPLLILNGMSSMSAVFAPNDHPLAQAPLTYHTKLIASAVALGNRLLAPPACNVVSSIDFSVRREGLVASHQYGVRCDLV